MYSHGTALVQEPERFAGNGAMLGCERWLGQDAGCKGRSSQLLFNYIATVEQPMNFQPYNLPCYRQGFQLLEQGGLSLSSFH